MTSIRRPLLRASLPLALALAALAPAATTVAAATPTLPAPTATVHFLTGIDFKAEVSLNADVRSIELILDVEGSTRSLVGELPLSTGTGTSTVSYEFETPGGAVLPNTFIDARLRLTMNDGTVVDGPTTTVHYDDTRFDWQTRTGEFVTVHWTEGGTAFGRRALQISDDAIRDVTDLLGVTESDPIDVYVYSDNSAFYDVIGAGARENVGGEAHPDIRTLFAQISPNQIDA